MPSASMGQVAGWAYDAGLRNPLALAKAVAVATAESGRDPGKKGDIGLQNATWGPSVGLWQIRSLKAEKGKGTVRDETKLTDPVFNAKAMVSISKSGADWSPWSVTHPTDLIGFARYTATLPIATDAVAGMLALKGTGQAVDATANAATDAASEVAAPVAAVLSDAMQTPAKIINWLTEPGTWTRIAILGTGAAFLVLGVGIVAKPVIGRSVSAVVQTVVPIGKATKLIKKGVR
jgi:hypothetical protein